MGMGGMIDVLFLASGFYLIWTAIMAKKRGRIAEKVMLSKDASEKDIKDKIGFINYVYKRILLAGLLITVSSIIHLANDYYIHSGILTWVGIAGVLVALIIYTTAYMGAQKRYMIQTNDPKKSKKERS